MSQPGSGKQGQENHLHRGAEIKLLSSCGQKNYAVSASLLGEQGRTVVGLTASWLPSLS